MSIKPLRIDFKNYLARDSRFYESSRENNGFTYTLRIIQTYDYHELRVGYNFVPMVCIELVRKTRSGTELDTRTLRSYGKEPFRVMKEDEGWFDDMVYAAFSFIEEVQNGRGYSHLDFLRSYLNSIGQDPNANLDAVFHNLQEEWKLLPEKPINRTG